MGDVLGNAPSISTSRDLEKARLRVSVATRKEIQIAQGGFFSGFDFRAGLASSNEYYFVLKAPADRYTIIEGITVNPTLGNATTGVMNIKHKAYLDDSNGNSWSYTPSSPLPAGRSLNGEFINSLPATTIEAGVSPSGLSGDPDYLFSDVNGNIDSQGRRDSFQYIPSGFFNNNVQLILKPDQAMLIQENIDGTFGGNIDLTTLWYFSEIPTDQFPDTARAP